MDPLPTPKQLAAHFATQGYRDPDQYAFRREQKTLTYETATGLFEEVLGGSGGGRCVCDFGSGLGYGLEVLHAHGYEAVGIELDDDAVRHSQAKGLHVLHGSDLSALGRGTEVDVVLYIDVLYYTVDPYRMLEAAYERLKPGGVLAARMSTWGGTARLVSGLGRFSAAARRLAPSLMCDHVAAYSPAGFRASVRRVGYRMVTERRDDSFSDLRQRGGWRWWSLRSVNPVARLISGDRIHLLPSLIYVAQKPV